MAKNDGPGSIATQMANAPIPGAGSFPFTIDGFRVDAKPSEWTPKNGLYTRKRTGAVLVRCGAYTFPAEVAVIFPADKSRKPVVEAKLPSIRFAGAMFTPAAHDKKSAEAAQHALDVFEKSMSDSFVKWYREQKDLPPLTARVIGASSSGVELDDEI